MLHVMGREWTQGKDEAGRWLPNDRPVPDDFAMTFVRIGRLACEEHYRAARETITRWLEESGADELKQERADHVRKQRQAKARSISRRQMGRMLDKAIPLPTGQTPRPIVVQMAARHLQCVRNGGWIVTRAGGGMWWVGAKKRTVAEVIEMARRTGFEPATLSRTGKGR